MASILGNRAHNPTTEAGIRNENKSSEFISNTHEIFISQIVANPFQPRTKSDQEKLNELAVSIEQLGIIQPITVRNMQDNKFQLISGERRLKASKIAGLEKIPAFIKIANDQQMLEMALVENIQRDDLNPIEEARGYKRLNEEFKYDHESISKLMSRSRSHISNTLRLLTLPSDVIAMLEEGTLTSGQARPLIGLPSATNIAEEIVSKNLSARSVELLVRDKKVPQKSGQLKMDSNICCYTTRFTFITLPRGVIPIPP